MSLRRVPTTGRLKSALSHVIVSIRRVGDLCHLPSLVRNRHQLRPVYGRDDNGITHPGKGVSLMSGKASHERSKSAKETPKPDGPVKEIVNSINMKLILIPAGKFAMGSPEKEAHRRPNEGPQHKVKITKPFYMSV